MRTEKRSGLRVHAGEGAAVFLPLPPLWPATTAAEAHTAEHVSETREAPRQPSGTGSALLSTLSALSASEDGMEQAEHLLRMPLLVNHGVAHGRLWVDSSSAKGA